MKNPFRRRNANAPYQPPQEAAWGPETPTPTDGPYLPQWAPVIPKDGPQLAQVSDLEALAAAAGVLRDPWGDAR